MSKLNNLSHTTQGKGIFLFHCNIRSLTKNLTLLNDMLYFLDSRPDVMAITETRLSSNSVSNLDISQKLRSLTCSKTSIQINHQLAFLINL